MNIQKFTQNSLQAVQNCEKVAYEYGNQEISQEHLLYALLTQDDSLILKLLEKMNIQKEFFINRVEQALNKRTKVQGGQVYMGQDLNQVLIHAEDEAKRMGDEYVSVEHLFLSLMKHANRELKSIFKEFGITRESFLQVLVTVRGNQRVTSDNPEATYDTLNKYGQDLVERAREQKLDPVIGRDAADVFGSFTLDRGTVDDVEINDAVISGEYLIGVVTEVSATSCVVRSVFDPSVNIAAYEIRTGELGYASASYDSSVDEQCRLTGLDTKTAISEGGIVCTSGTGGIFPKDLIIGTVTSVEQSETDLSSYAIIEPVVSAKGIHDCFIITSYEEK